MKSHHTPQKANTLTKWSGNIKVQTIQSTEIFSPQHDNNPQTDYLSHQLVSHVLVFSVFPSITSGGIYT